MTRQTFYRFLKRTQKPGDWYLTLSGRIRRGSTLVSRCVCPLGALPSASEALPSLPSDIGDVMSKADMQAIYHAADNDGVEDWDDLAHDPRVRKALLRNLGLTEATT